MDTSTHRLELANGTATLPHRPNRQAYSAVLKDVQEIHNPGSSWIANAWRRAGLLERFELTADEDNPTSFSAKAYRFDAHEASIAFDNPHRPRQAAGWAALQLYREKTAGPLKNWFTFRDPCMQTRRFRSSTPEIRFSEDVDKSGFELPSTEVGFDNKFRGRPLLGVLHTLQSEYDKLYPQAGFDSSQVVAGIVGARNLDDFTAAWVSVEKLDPPVRAARMLLESDVFLDT